MNKIRILQVVPDMRSGGVENFLMNVYRNINRDKIQFDFMEHYSEESFFDKEIEQLGGRIYRIPLRKDNNIVKYIFKLNRFYKEHKEYKIVHCHWNGMGFIHLLVAWINGVKIRIGHSHNSTAGVGIKGFIKRLLIAPYKYVCNIRFACSDEAGKFLYGKKHFEFIPNGIDVERFRFNKQKRINIRKEFGIGENSLVLGNIGRLNIQKNQKFLIDVFEIVHQLNVNSYLLIVGVGELYDELKEYVIKKKLENCIVFAGVHANVEDYYSAMDIFCLPSLFEGLPLTALEAQSSGLLTLLSDNVSRQVEICENVVYLYNRNIDSWVDCIISHIDKMKLLNRQSLNTKAIESIYNIKIVADKIEQFYASSY